MPEEIHSFRHEAMNTWFEMSVFGTAREFARKAATEAFREIDRLENLLSRFREGSDVDILNKRASREPVRVTAECWNCLLLALDLEILTGGIFSIAFEAFMKKKPDDEPIEVGAWLEMDPSALTVLFHHADTRVDLGGIGKGYALDLVVDLMGEWELENFLLHSGTSSVVARGSRGDLAGWPVSVGADVSSKEVLLVDESLSGSSLAVQDSHILDLRSREVLDTRRRAWAWAPGAAISDALSTSFMAMPMEGIAGLCKKYPSFGALVIDPETGDAPQAFGVALERL